jgi:hypothetical protein
MTGGSDEANSTSAAQMSEEELQRRNATFVTRQPGEGSHQRTDDLHGTAADPPVPPIPVVAADAYVAHSAPAVPSVDVQIDANGVVAPGTQQQVVDGRSEEETADEQRTAILNFSVRRALEDMRRAEAAAAAVNPGGGSGPRALGAAPAAGGAGSVFGLRPSLVPAASFRFGSVPQPSYGGAESFTFGRGLQQPGSHIATGERGVQQAGAGWGPQADAAAMAARGVGLEAVEAVHRDFARGSDSERLNVAATGGGGALGFGFGTGIGSMNSALPAGSFSAGRASQQQVIPADGFTLRHPSLHQGQRVTTQEVDVQQMEAVWQQTDTAAMAARGVSLEEQQLQLQWQDQQRQMERLRQEGVTLQRQLQQQELERLHRRGLLQQQPLLQHQQRLAQHNGQQQLWQSEPVAALQGVDRGPPPSYQQPGWRHEGYSRIGGPSPSQRQDVASLLRGRLDGRREERDPHSASVHMAELREDIHELTKDPWSLLAPEHNPGLVSQRQGVSATPYRLTGAEGGQRIGAAYAPESTPGGYLGSINAEAFIDWKNYRDKQDAALSQFSAMLSMAPRPIRALYEEVGISVTTEGVIASPRLTHTQEAIAKIFRDATKHGRIAISSDSPEKATKRAATRLSFDAQLNYQHALHGSGGLGMERDGQMEQRADQFNVAPTSKSVNAQSDTGSNKQLIAELVRWKQGGVPKNWENTPQHEVPLNKPEDERLQLMDKYNRICQRDDGSSMGTSAVGALLAKQDRIDRRGVLEGITISKVSILFQNYVMSMLGARAKETQCLEVRAVIQQQVIDFQSGFQRFLEVLAGNAGHSGFPDDEVAQVTDLLVVIRYAFGMTVEPKTRALLTNLGFAQPALATSAMVGGAKERMVEATVAGGVSAGQRPLRVVGQCVPSSVVHVGPAGLEKKGLCNCCRAKGHDMFECPKLFYQTFSVAMPGHDRDGNKLANYWHDNVESNGPSGAVASAWILHDWKQDILIKGLDAIKGGGGVWQQWAARQ